MKSITNIVKQCRKVKYSPFFDYHKEKHPLLWSPTRWSGKYKMVRFICKREQFVTELGEQYPELDIFLTNFKFLSMASNGTLLKDMKRRSDRFIQPPS
uniref:Uncharacterized protein n=1 Tax=Anopheles christyi TaxID=43041 RepID=A0A182KHJ3_9DIPT